MNEEWDINTKAGNQKNVDHYTVDAIRIDNGKIYEGKEAIGKLLRSYIEEYTILTYENKVENILVSGDLATARGSFLSSFIDKESGDTLHQIAGWVGIYERQSEGSWNAVYSLGTDELKD